MKVAAEYLRLLHERLLAGEPTASAILADLLLPLVHKHLRFGRFSRVDEELRADAAVDAVTSYLQKPHLYEPSVASLDTYLKKAGENCIQQLLRKVARIHSKESPLSGVEVETHDNNIEKLVDDALSKELRNRVIELVTDEKDLAILELVFAGERDTSVFAQLLGMSELSSKEQRHEVKKHKDRLMRRLRRAGITQE